VEGAVTNNDQLAGIILWPLRQLWNFVATTLTILVVPFLAMGWLIYRAVIGGGFYFDGDNSAVSAISHVWAYTYPLWFGFACSFAHCAISKPEQYIGLGHYAWQNIKGLGWQVAGWLISAGPWLYALYQWGHGRITTGETLVLLLVLLAIPVGIGCIKTKRFGKNIFAGFLIFCGCVTLLVVIANRKVAVIDSGSNVVQELNLEYNPDRSEYTGLAYFYSQSDGEQGCYDAASKLSESLGSPNVRGDNMYWEKWHLVDSEKAWLTCYRWKYDGNSHSAVYVVYSR
jgi:hypothetical protein